MASPVLRFSHMGVFNPPPLSLSLNRSVVPRSLLISGVSVRPMVSLMAGSSVVAGPTGAVDAYRACSHGTTKQSAAASQLGHKNCFLDTSLSSVACPDHLLDKGVCGKTTFPRDE